jgi:transcriptional regulator with XRE-family HTH domain
LENTRLEAGTTQECLAHFAEFYSFLAARRLLAEFTGVSSVTASDWLRGIRMPKGLQLMRLRVFLTLVGYSVKEVMELPEDNRKLAEIVAYGILEEAEARTELGYKDEKSILSMTLRGQKMMPSSSFRLERLLRAHEQQRQEHKDESFDRIQKVLGGEMVIGTRPVPKRPDEPEYNPAAANGSAGSYRDELRQLIEAMDARNDELQQALDEERAAHAATKAVLEGLREQIERIEPIEISALREKYFGPS